ncbi:M1 family aminopeptidase [Candidatus Thiothrix sp. Deng01]|uniref:M1 family aminopeptidase n=1 Tax=Candidatus Thiothrix phosphatis TaxID=3112415 RepID=A0ABU6CZ31_9GAMM|nr:M1 family aminopeptidase [Candidatus Thiothrix sp. Deng01]MEB4591349.1 M1 family aminopeptidase [Candidatus Thiothrix sp. Deng01]
MRLLNHLVILLVVFLPIRLLAADPPVLDHVLRVTPDVSGGGLQVEDSLRVPAALRANGRFEFGLGPQFTLDAPVAQPVSPGRYSIPFPEGAQEITLKYHGRLASTEDCAWLAEACVLLSERGMYLDGGSRWYAQSGDTLHTFALQASLPTGWVSLSQGEQSGDGWHETHPQDEIYLLAGKFHVYQQPGKHATAMVYLQQDAPELAKRYLQTAQQYLDEYSALLGDYPYAKFATVESFWETGWGMPSFTLLGPKVLRLPFILHSSFPHEILHNWWGNGVYVDASGGNWSEGLTAYLADQRIKERMGEGAEYRRSTLQQYAAFVGEHDDFPLSRFRSRHDAASQAIGYGKAMMLFHMLRQQLGDEKFFAGLRDFYRTYRFHRATFNQLLDSLKVDAAFRQRWVDGVGAPSLAIQSQTLTQEGSGYRLQLTLKQQQAGAAFPLAVPVRIRFADAGRLEQHETLHMQQASQSFELMLPAKPAQAAIDPDFDLFRLPDPAELPAAINTLYGTAEKTYVLARQTDDAMQVAWESWLDTLKAADKNLRVQYDDAPLPDTGAVILLGGDNAALQGLLDRAQEPFRLTDAAYTLNSVNYTCGLHTLALALHAGRQNIVLLDASSPDGLDRMLAKLPHYGKYSYLVFNSATGENVAKGQWEVTDSPLTVSF